MFPWDTFHTQNSSYFARVNKSERQEKSPPFRLSLPSQALDFLGKRQGEHPSRHL